MGNGSDVFELLLTLMVHVSTCSVSEFEKLACQNLWDSAEGCLVFCTTHSRDRKS